MLTGGRIYSIALKLELSPHTVRNHLRRIFSKMKVNSQTDLIRLVTDNPTLIQSKRNSPAPLSFEPESSQNEVDDIIQADTIIKYRIGIMLREQLANTLKKLVRLILPLDQERKQAWKSHLVTWINHSSEPDQTAQHADQEVYYRELLKAGLSNLKDNGLFQADLDIDNITRGLSIAITGVALELMRNPDSSRQAGQLTDLDQYIDSLLC